jgi:aminopeptidase N
MFDGISYGKGASFLKQLLHFFGKDVIVDGLRSYFKKYAFSNTTKK